MGWEVWAYSLKSDFHHLVQCRAAASVCKRKRGRRESTGSARLDQGPLQVPLQPTASTWLYTQGSCDKAVSVTVLLCASGRYEKCIWMRADHLVHITFRVKKKAALLSSTCPFLTPATKPWPQEHIVWAGKCWMRNVKQQQQRLSLTATVLPGMVLKWGMSATTPFAESRSALIWRHEEFKKKSIYLQRWPVVIFFLIQIWFSKL